VAYLSTLMSLQPGDIIATGTPPGVGMGQSPKRFLKDGDEMQLAVTSLGTQQQVVRQAR
ncbi:MAG: fumarylacetoacetate hydrolase family protein, partial [Pseudomonadota bacterium]